MCPTFEVVASGVAVTSSANTGDTEATPANPARDANATDLRLMCFIDDKSPLFILIIQVYHMHP